MTVFFGTKRVYADLPAEGSTVRTLIAAPGQQISAHFEHLVPDDAKTTERPRRRSIHDAALVHNPTIVAPVAGDQVVVDRGQVVDGTGAAAGGAPAVDVDELKGDALEEKLDELGLSKSGTADEKRARVAEALAAGDAR